MEKDFLIIDANNLVHRAYHGYSKLSVKRDDFLAYGFKTMFGNLLRDFNPEFLAVVFDDEEDNFRHKLYPDYKANRPKKSDEMAEQMLMVRDWVDQNYPYFSVHGYEADDVIGTLVKKAEIHGGFKTYVVSSDKDLTQLVSDKTLVYNSQAKIMYDRERVFGKFGVYPEKVLEFLSLQGDESDNVPGLYKCGPASAKNLINHYGSIEKMIENPDEAFDVLKSNKEIIVNQLKNESEKLLLAKQLISLDCEVPLSLKLKDIKIDAKKKVAKRLKNS